MKKRILILTDWFSPGYKAGGPIQSLVNFTQTFCDKYDISILTTAYDLNETEPYPDLPQNQWVEAYNSRVYYLSKDKLNYATLKQVITAEKYDYFYINSMYSVFFTLFPLWILYGKKNIGQIVLAPRGMLKAGAMSLKRTKKMLFIRLFRWLNIAKEIKWQATDKEETENISFFFGKGLAIQLVPNLPKQVAQLSVGAEKKVGAAQFVFCGRVAIVKQLHFFLERLKHQQGEITLEVYGNWEEEEYVAKCKAIVADLPSNIRVEFHGATPNHLLIQKIQVAQFLIQPSLSENFGHAIFDGLAAGKPILISDKTPWQNLEQQQIGWDIPLSDTKKWEQIIQICINMDNETYQFWAKNAYQFARNFAQQPALIQSYTTLFE